MISRHLTTGNMCKLIDLPQFSCALDFIESKIDLRTEKDKKKH